MANLPTVAPRVGSANPLSAELRRPRPLQVLRRRFWTIAGACLLGVVTALGYLSVAPFKYTAEATLSLAVPDGHGNTDIKSGGFLGLDLPTIRTQVQVLESWSMAAQAVEKLGLVERPPAPEEPTWLDLPWLVEVSWLTDWLAHVFGREQHTARSAISYRLLDVVDEFRRGISVATDGRSYVIQVRYQARDPKFAEAAANALAQVYLDDQLEYKSESLSRLSRWLTRRTEEARNKLHDSEWGLSLLRQQSNITETKGLTVSQQQLAELNSQLVLATAELAQREARARSLHDIARGAGDAEAAPEVLASPLIQLLRDQEAQLLRQAGEIASRYGDKYPAARGVQVELADLRRKIAVEVDKIAQSIAAEADVARSRVQSLKATIAGLQRTVSTANSADVRIHELEQQVETDRGELTAYMTHATEAADEELLVRADARLVSPAVEPVKPSAPKALLVLAFGLGSGLMVGLLLAALRDRTDDRARGIGQTEAITGLPCLGLVPHLSRARGGHAPVEEVIDRPESLFSEAVRSVGALLEARSAARAPRVVLVTSALPNAGKTFFSISLARSSALAGQKVLLVDCNMRGPAVAAMLQCSDGGGLEEVVRGRELGMNPIRTDVVSGLHVLPTQPSERLHEVLSSPALTALVDEARRHYDLVILDSPALMQGPDVLMLWRLADVGLVLVPWRRTRLNALLRALHRLVVRDGKRLATLLSDVPPAAYRRYVRGRVM
ncbi:MAG TPA: polysaccharide biosynthesis tyrosine autokinase [Candidatus Sulfotelmatobacter sp.]|nr:polysaccharide biosynthesis tyrosine autokinase [Candidatus Sulfotelmatobacter sp.]